MAAGIRKRDSRRIWRNRMHVHWEDSDHRWQLEVIRCPLAMWVIQWKISAGIGDWKLSNDHWWFELSDGEKECSGVNWTECLLTRMSFTYKSRSCVYQPLDLASRYEMVEMRLDLEYNHCFPSLRPPPSKISGWSRFYIVDGSLCVKFV